ncbi:sensor histidine kinase [Bacillus solimangrovi]|uniref:histidine kinase n=1 Tax=Bacillus solimangrovi TaxID=1305675 RepID=A0A1E5LAI2_9BACI|nr:HAMP domain-containing sensor histidine kinase [Bacillus solimangrovi]OEH91055.1 two-component sensor histidine kinase [Bacillus solimangrovi]
MLRHQETRTLLVIMCLITVCVTVLGAFVSFHAMVLVFISCVLLIGSAVFFTSWRYRDIEKLSNYLRQISAGDYTLDVRDNRESELSILKNNIYKVTSMLSEQSALLQKDKSKLTDAISDISHQLKTPLTSMMVMTDLLSDDELPTAKRNEFTHNLRIQIERIEWLVSSLLKLSKIDAGTVQFKKDRVKVEKLIQKALEPVLIPMDIKDQSISIKGEDNVAFTGDLNWTVEAIINILKNCVEHTPENGEITISFSENTLYTEIIITDSGKGIAKQDRPYIFKRFYKGKNANADSIGIGLAIAYSIIKSQNGDIEVQSKEGEGTRFLIKFYKQVI